MGVKMMSNRKNIVLLTIECLRKKECNIPSNVPNLHRIAKKSLVYENFYQSSSWTLPSMYSIFTSKYPLMNGGRVSLTKSDLTFTEILQKNGYYTLGLTPGGWLSRYFGFDKGFTNFYDDVSNSKQKQPFLSNLKKLIMNKGAKIETLVYLYFYKNYYCFGRRKSERLNSIALKWLNNQSGGKPFFLWIHYPETHEPYYPPRHMTNYRFKEIWRLNKKIMKDIRSRRRGELKLSLREKAMLSDLYKSELKYVDKSVGDLLEKLDAAGYLDEDTYVFIMGDHGQQLLEHGDFGHGIYLYQELCNVPLLIYNKNYTTKKEEMFVSGIDIAPTILHLADITPPPHFLGESIFHVATVNRDIILQEGRDKRNDFIIKGNNVYLNIQKYKVGLVKYPYKLIVNSNDKDELYNLEEDPKEENNLIDTEIKISNNLRKQLERHLRQMWEIDFKKRTKNKIKNLKARGKI